MTSATTSFDLPNRTAIATLEFAQNWVHSSPHKRANAGHNRRALYHKGKDRAGCAVVVLQI